MEHAGEGHSTEEEHWPHETQLTDALPLCVTHMTCTDGRGSQLGESTDGHVSSVALEAEGILPALGKHWAGCEHVAKEGPLLKVLPLHVEGQTTLRSSLPSHSTGRGTGTHIGSECFLHLLLQRITEDLHTSWLHPTHNAGQ